LIPKDASQSNTLLVKSRKAALGDGTLILKALSVMIPVK
jgi:hypothetical protein